MPMEPSRFIHVESDEAIVVFEGGEAFTFRDHPPVADGEGGAAATAPSARRCRARSPASRSRPATR